jgi:hypothetical protein
MLPTLGDLLTTQGQYSERLHNRCLLLRDAKFSKLPSGITIGLTKYFYNSNGLHLEYRNGARASCALRVLHNNGYPAARHLLLPNMKLITPVLNKKAKPTDYDGLEMMRNLMTRELSSFNYLCTSTAHQFDNHRADLDRLLNSLDAENVQGMMRYLFEDYMERSKREALYHLINSMMP